MKENHTENLIENDMQLSGSQLLGFLAPGGGGLVLSSLPGQAGSRYSLGNAPPVMAIPISALFVKHESRRKQAVNKTA